MNATSPKPPAAVGWITRTLEEAGHETWAVGGAVRDALAGCPSGDWDLTTHARPEEVSRIFRRTVPIGIEHGTVGVLARDGTMYEVTTFRRDVETDGRHAVVAFADRVEDDLARRDFTINAIAWHALREELFDPYGGAEDLEQRVLRTVGDPTARFAEDYLRILRAFRFAGRFGLRIDSGTWSAACGAIEHLPSLSAERIREELLKVLSADPAPSVALGLYADSRALGVLYPELEALHDRGGADPIWSRTLAAIDVLPIDRPHLRLAALLSPLDRDVVSGILIRLKLSNALIDEVARRAGAGAMPSADSSDETFRRWLSTQGPERISAIARLDLARAKVSDDAAFCEAVVASWRKARAVRASGAALAVGDLDFDGRDLISMGLSPGPDFGRILDHLLDFVLEDPARNDREVLATKAKELTSTGALDD